MIASKRWKLPVVLLLMVVLTWPALSVSAQTPASTTVYIDNEPIKTTVINQHGYQLVPARFFQKFGVTVNWSPSYQAAILRNASIEIGYPVSKSYTDYQHVAQGSWSRDQLDTETVLVGGVSYVPLAYTAKKLGLHVRYDSKLRAAILSTQENSIVALSNTNTNTNQPTEEELYWLNQITEAEAGGESFDGKVAVAASILNRVEDPAWPSNIIDTIFQVEYYNGKSYYQYSPVLDKRIHTVKPSEETKRAVQQAINGFDPSMGAVVFYNPDKTDNAWVRSRPVTTKIGNHVFAK